MDRPKPLRLFVAADVPPDHLDAVERATVELRDSLSDARWTSTDNRHVTLKFLGATDPDLLPQVESVVRSAAAAEGPGELELTGLGAFPSATRARVLWIGLNDPSNILTRLASGLERGFAPLGFEPEARSFTPHLTLARLKTPARLDPVPELDLSRLEPFELDRIALWRSQLSPKGATYERLGEFALGGHCP
jgi:2'-5' RNA ligase